MQKINFDQIMLNSNTVDVLSDEATDQLMLQFDKEQPYLVDYLVSTFKHDLSEAQHEDLFYLGTRLWAAIRQIYPDIPIITAQEIAAAADYNDDMLLWLAHENEESSEKFAQIMLEDYSQSELLAYVIVAIEELTEDADEELDKETHGRFFITLKTIIDCLEKILP
jgi:hypothetical protein